MIKRIRAKSSVREDGDRVEDTSPMRGDACPRGTTREDGAILMLALAYLIAVSLVVAVLSTWATNDLNNSSSFTSANSLTLAASDMTDVAIQYVRYNPIISDSQPVKSSSSFVACWGGTDDSSIPVIDGDQVAVWCSTYWDPSSAQTRDVTFDACPVNVPQTACTGSNVLLASEVRYDDYPPVPAHSAPIQDLCSTWCGSGMEVVSWQWGTSSSNFAVAKATALTFTSDPSTTTVGGTTTAQVTATDANGPVSGDAITLLESTGPSSGITSSSSTLMATTNASGIAEFTNIEPQAVGSYVLEAIDINGVQTTSSSFTVHPARSTFIDMSSVPTGATENGPTYTPSAQATSGDVVKITLDAGSSGCKLNASGVISFTAAGTCKIDFNDPGNANFSPAFQVTQSFPVGGLTVTSVTIALGTSNPAASATTNDSVTMTLRNASGAIVTSSGTTSVVLSDVGSGNFSSTSGATGSSTLVVNFSNGSSTATAYFGGETTGPDTITVVSGSTPWGTANLTVQGGVATQVAISTSPSTPVVSALTDTALSFQLEDQYGNTATSVGTTTLALTDSGNGFFASASGVAGASTLNVTFANGSGTATAYFGDQTSGSNTITTKNGGSVWAKTVVTLAAGAPASMQITLSPTTPTKSGVTNTTVTVQLFDQFGNYSTTSGVAVTLSNSGNGFFATKSGTSVIGGAAPTLALSTNASGVATGYFGDNVVQSDSISASGAGIVATTAPFTV